jgi:Skp family chaperone for outer membrane proteins
MRADQRFATANIFQVVEKLVQGERYRPARDAMMKEYGIRLDAAQKELEQLYQRINEAGEESDEGRAMIAQFQAKQREAQQLDQELQDRAGAFNTQQLSEAYRIAVETVNDLAKQGGYTHVLATRGAVSEPLVSTNVAAAVQEILARPAIVYPTGDDLTEAAIKMLKVDGVVTPAEGAAPAPSVLPVPAPADAGGK